MRATAGRGVATPRRRAKVHRTPPGAQNRALRSRIEHAAAALHNGNYPGHRRVVSEQLRSRRVKLTAHAATKVRQDKAVHPSRAQRPALRTKAGTGLFQGVWAAIIPSNEQTRLNGNTPGDRTSPQDSRGDRKTAPAGVAASQRPSLVGSLYAETALVAYSQPNKKSTLSRLELGC